MDKNTEKVWKVLIVGYGVVGHNLHREIAKGRNIRVDVVDKYKPDCNTATRERPTESERHPERE